MNDTLRDVEALSPEKKRARLAQILRSKANGPRSFPLSFAQQRLWFLDQLEPNNPAYSIPAAFRIKGPLNVPVLQKSLGEIQRRHQILRTRFETVNGKAAQIIVPEMTVELPVVDLENLPESERETEMWRLLEQEIQTPFDLARAPLWRAALFYLRHEENVLLLTMHHIISDAWSLGVFMREMAEFYQAFLAEPTLSTGDRVLPELPTQYSDFALRQRRWLEGETAKKQLSYWKQQLTGVPTSLDLPTDHPRSARQTFQGDKHSIHLSKELTQSLKKLSLDERSTIFMTLLAAFKVMLYRYTGQHDISVGTPIANRDQEDIENLIGFFVNTLVLRVNLDSSPCFREVLAQVREVALAAYDYQGVPFEKLVDELQPERDLSRPPLFQVMFGFLNTPTQSLNIHLSGLILETLDVYNSRSKFDLALHMWEKSDQLSGWFEYNTDLFETDTIERMTEHFRTILDAVTRNPDQPISQIPFLTELERKQQLVQWNATEKDYPYENLLHNLFEERVERTPEAVALVFESRRLTYRELNTRTNQLAHLLCKLGVGPDVLVGICVERSLEMVVGLFAILKAGGAYVPLDPAYPKERLAFILEDAQATVLLTQQSLMGSLPEQKARLICLDKDWEAIAKEAVYNLNVNVTSENLAYVIYTSGSTGRPKGVAIAHRNVSALIHWARTVYDEEDLQGVLASTSICFDLSVFELFLPLCCSGKVILAENALALPTLPAKEEVKLVNTVPSAMTELVKNGGIPSSVRTINLAGEPLEQKLADAIYARGVERVFDLYGPSEDTTYSTYTLRQSGGLETIGRPIDNTKIYILDRNLQPVAIGTQGELYIEGHGVVRCYLARPQLTAEKFIPNPFSDAPGTRLYKTGDLARYLPDGNIVFVGRVDHQVKIRGFRIELDEIKIVLSNHPDILECIVIAREDVPGEKRLVAYLIADRQASPKITELRHFLREQLPEYMVPHTFVFIDLLPLTPNGKIDRRALPVPDASRPELEGNFVEPQTAAQKVLTDIWSKLLRLDKVGIHDNFFELGGDSILSIQIIARANHAGLRLTPRQIFEHQTIAELASVAGTVQTQKSEQGPVTGPVQFTPIQHWFFEQRLLNPHHFNQSMLLEIRKPLDFNLLKKVLQELVVYHDTLRLRFEKKGDGWQQVIVDPETEVPLTRIDLLRLPKDEQSTAIESHAANLQASLNLSEGPLMQFVFFDLGSQRPGRLLMIIHHLAIDGVSWRILLSDLQTAYQQLYNDHAIQFPPKTTSFQDWAQRLIDYAHSEKFATEQNYWASSLARVSNPLPIDTPSGEGNTIASAQLIKTALNAEETRALLQDVPKTYRTQINDVLLTALVQAFGQWTGSESLLIDLEGHGREDLIDDVDLSRTIGWFTTIFPVQLDLGNTSNPGDALKTIKEQLRSIPKQGIGYGLFRYLNRERDIAKQMKKVSQAEVSFNYLGQFDQVLSESALFGFAHEDRGPALSSKETSSYLLELNSRVVEGKLEVAWTYSSYLHYRTTVEKLAQDFMTRLRAVIFHCKSLESGGYTPSDFSLTKLNQHELDVLIKKKLKKS